MAGVLRTAVPSFYAAYAPCGLCSLIKCKVEELEYRIFGYKGKQARDNIHSWDVARFIHCVIEAPRAGQVYNLRGGKKNSCSILEAFQLAAD